MSRGTMLKCLSSPGLWPARLGLIGLILLLVIFANGREEPVWGHPTTQPQGPSNCTDAKCHDSFAEKKHRHPLVVENRCTECHKTMKGENHKFEALQSQPELCTRCHDGLLAKKDFLHGPVAAGSCTVCHDVHGTSHRKELVAEPRALCLECHVEMDAILAESAYRHKPVQEDCTSCHDPHASRNKVHLKLPPKQLCLDCHKDIARAAHDGPVKHTPVTSNDACFSCHLPHSSDHAHLLKKPEKDTCLSCHSQALKDADGGRIQDIGHLLKTASQHHGPVIQGNCTACHSQIHGGQGFRLLGASYPSTFYTGFKKEKYALCFKCHEPELVTVAVTDRLTRFRNGDVNLHYLHVNKDKKGRTCRACHETHASTLPKHIRESVPFGRRGWKLPTKFIKTKTGGSCQPGCHKKYRYDRLEPFENIKPKNVVKKDKEEKK